MRVLVQVRGPVDEVELWPYVSSSVALADGSLLNVDVVDGRELVGVLVALLDRGLEVVKVETLRDSSGPHRPGSARGRITPCG